MNKGGGRDLSKKKIETRTGGKSSSASTSEKRKWDTTSKKKVIDGSERGKTKSRPCCSPLLREFAVQQLEGEAIRRCFARGKGDTSSHRVRDFKITGKRKAIHPPWRESPDQFRGKICPRQPVLTSIPARGKGKKALEGDLSRRGKKPASRGYILGEEEEKEKR